MWPVVTTLRLPGGVVPITSYGLLLVVAVALIATLAPTRARALGIPAADALNLLALAISCGLLGARLLFLAVNLQALLADPVRTLAGQGGLVWYGGFAGGALATILYAYHYRIPLPILFDLAAPMVALGHGLGRVGCFLSGCCYGGPTDQAWGVRFPPSEYYRGPVGIALHPVQLYEAAFELSLGVALFIWGRRPRGGRVLIAYLAASGSFRLAMEIFFRGDDRGTLGLPVPPSAALSLLVLGIAAVLAFNLKAPTAQPH